MKIALTFERNVTFGVIVIQVVAIALTYASLVYHFQFSVLSGFLLR